LFDCFIITQLETAGGDFVERTT